MDIRPRLAVIIPGIGHPHWAHKVQILRSNIATFANSGHWRHVHFYVCIYDDSPTPPDLISRQDFTVFRRKGQLCDNIYHLFQPAKFAEFDDIVLLLDDVELTASSSDWPRAMRIKRAANLDILSPCMSHPGMTPWQHMNHDATLKPNCVTFMTVCELFCYVMNLDAYRKYFQLIDPANPGMWGIDLVLWSHMKLRCGTLNGLTMKHHYTDGDHQSKQRKVRDADLFLRRLGTSWAQALRQDVVVSKQCFM